MSPLKEELETRSFMVALCEMVQSRMVITENESKSVMQDLLSLLQVNTQAAVVSSKVRLNEAGFSKVMTMGLKQS